MEKRDYLPCQEWGIDRRSFLRLSGMLGMSLASAAFIPVPAEAVKSNKEMYKVSRTRSHT